MEIYKEKYKLKETNFYIIEDFMRKIQKSKEGVVLMHLKPGRESGYHHQHWCILTKSQRKCI